MVLLGRGLGVSRVGSNLGGLSYAFGAPVLFLYCYVIFLVGAAWIPWGLWAIDRLLRQGRLRGGGELAVVLALQVLGGDPEAAYLTAVCGAGYAVVLTIRARARPAPLAIWPVALGMAGVWVMATLGVAYTRSAPPRLRSADGLVLAAWVAVGLGMAWRWCRRPNEARLAPLLAGLAVALILAASLAAVQILPALEFAGQSWRAGGIAAPTSTTSASTPAGSSNSSGPTCSGRAVPRIAPGSRPSRPPAATMPGPSRCTWAARR